MTDQGLPADVVRTLDAAVRSVDELDVLLMLLEDAGRWWGHKDLARAIGVDVDSARDALRNLTTRGLAIEIAGGGIFRLAADPRLPLPDLAELARMCRRQRRAVVDYVTGRSVVRLGVLAEAFKRGSGG